MKKILVLAVLALTLYYTWEPVQHDAVEQLTRSEQAAPGPYGEVASGEQLRGSGVVVKILPDDNDGSRHQRFILRAPSGGTVLIAHNIDLAPRIPVLEVGDTVEFYGVYEANARGGVIHWTHHDPQGRHVAGWLEHEGRIYQ